MASPCFRLVKGSVYCPMKSFLVDMSKSSTTNRTRASAGISMSNVNSSSHFGLKPGQQKRGWRLERLTNQEGGGGCSHARMGIRDATDSGQGRLQTGGDFAGLPTNGDPGQRARLWH